MTVELISTRSASTDARGAAALVGSPHMIADCILDYVELSAEMISIRGGRQGAREARGHAG